MFYSNTLNLIQVGGGTQVKQGDLCSKFSYKLANEKDQELNDFDKEVAHINLVLDDKIVFTTTATVDNSTVTFNIDKAIPVGLYFLEIKIRDYIFPSDKQTIIFVQSGAVAYDLKELVPNYDVNMTLDGILSDLTQKGIDISDLKRRIAEKVNKDEVTNVMTPKGNIAYASLPMEGNSVGWYYYCPDGDGTHGAGNYVWNGTSWYFGGTGDEGYNLLKEDIANKIDKPNTSDNNKFPRAKNGNVEWVEHGLPTDEQTASAVTNWLDEHPEATTTVQDGSITEPKINAEFLPYIKNEYVTPEMFGAVGDGVADDTESFNKCIKHSRLILLSAGKKYNVTNLPYNANYIVRGFGAHNEYEQTNTMPIIKNLSITGSLEWNDKSQCFENVQLENCALSNLNKLILNNCHIRKSSIINLRGGRVESSFFQDCEEAISGIVDSIVSNTTFTSCKGFCIKGGSSSTIIGNRFQWSKVGLDLHFSQDLLVTSNWFDRNENAIVLQENTEVSIVDNVFKRSVYSHIKGKINNCVINNNKFIYANIYESDSEEIKIGPAAVFEITGFDRSTLVGNQILKKTNDVKLFIKAVGVTTDTNAIYGNIVDNVPLESRTKRITFTAAQENIFQMANIIDKGSYASAIEFSVFYQGNFFAVPEVTFKLDGIHINAPSLKVGEEYLLNTRIIYRDISVL